LAAARVVFDIKQQTFFQPQGPGEATLLQQINAFTMPKRKRDFTAASGEDLNPTALAAAATERVRRFFPFAVNQIARALKSAKAFERQKLGRRLKSSKAAGEDSVAQRQENELSSLKVSSAYGLEPRSHVRTSISMPWQVPSSVKRSESHG
jgi:hypothetical protein